MKNNTDSNLQLKVDIMGRIQIPKPIRKQLSILDNEMLDLEVGKDYLLFKKINRPPSDKRRIEAFNFDDARMKRIRERKEKFTEGTYVRCLTLDMDDNPIPQDMVGIVNQTDDLGSVHITWYNGREVAALDIPGDVIEVISEQEYNSYKG